MSDSQESGFIPAQDAPADDDELLDLLQPIIAGIGGWLVPGNVRPQWQNKEVPNNPQFEEDWCSFGIKNFREDTYQFEENNAQGDGVNVFEYSEEFDVLISTYGPRSSQYVRNLRDGFRLEQNRAPLQALKIDTLYVNDQVVLPALLHGTWVRRVDVSIVMRRYVSRRYAIKTIQSASAGLDNEQYVTSIGVGP